MANATKSGAAPLVRAVYQRLNVAAITTTLGAGVYSDVPQGAVLPYVRIETEASETWSTMGAPGEQLIVSTHIFATRERTVDDIVDAIVGRLDGYALVVTGFSVWGVLYERVHRGEDEIINGVKTFHKIPTFRVFLREA
jgi:hypothetical protein